MSTAYSPVRGPMAAALVAALALAGCAGTQEPGRAEVEYRGTDPTGAASGARPAPGAILAHDGYYTALAREGETVAELAARAGVDPADLAAYNGRAATQALRGGEELVLPPRAEGYEVAAAAPDPAPAPAPPPAIEAAPLDTGAVTGVDTPAPDSVSPDAGGRAGEPGSDPTGDPAQDAPPSGWSAGLASAAIDRASGQGGTEGPGETVPLGAPPSAADPLPDDPQPAPDLASPGLGRYQSGGPSPQAAGQQEAGAAAASAPPRSAAEGDGADAPVPGSRGTQAAQGGQSPAPARRPTAEAGAGSDTPGAESTDLVARRPADPAPPDRSADTAAAPADDPGRARAADTAPASAPGGTDEADGRFLRPVSGPVALGFGPRADGGRNEGVDFAAPAGAPVRAAADGEVALVSEALGGLGTIVLLRHPDDLLTVYGRLADVRVVKGEIVARGQRIGSVAAPEPPAEPRMHFEIREGADAVDPMAYLGE